jgi:hypothetical protein
MNEVRKSIHDLNNKVSNINGKFSKDTEILEKKVVRNISNEKHNETVQSNINRLDQERISQEEISEIDDNVKEILHSDNNKEKI